MKTDVKKVLSLVLRQKKPVLRTSPFHAREYIFREEKREREERRRRVLSSKASSSLGPLLFVFVFFVASLKQRSSKEREKDFSNPPLHKTLNIRYPKYSWGKMR